MSKNFLIPLGVVAFAVTLAIMMRDSISGEARLVAAGIAVGLIIGVPVGMWSMALARRAGRADPLAPPSSGALSLSPEQTDMLLRAVEHQQASPHSFGLASRQERTFHAVGGADLLDGAGDTEDRG
jgi:hypothetical protein